MKNPVALILVFVLGPSVVHSIIPKDSYSMLRPKLGGFVKNFMDHYFRFSKLFMEQMNNGTFTDEDLKPFIQATAVRDECLLKKQSEIESNHKEYYEKMAAIDRKINSTSVGQQDPSFGIKAAMGLFVRASTIMNDPDFMKEWQLVGDEQVKVALDCDDELDSNLKNDRKIWNLWEESRTA